MKQNTQKSPSSKAIRIITLIVVAVLILLALCALIFYWYWFLDTGNLVFYDKDRGNIVDIYTKGDTYYFVLDSGELYISSGFGSPVDRQYYNAVHSGTDTALMVAKPIRAFSGEISKVIPVPNYSAFIITSNNELFYSVMSKVSKIADNVADAGARIVRNATDNCYYYVDMSERLHCIPLDSDRLPGDDIIVADGIRKIEVLDYTAYCITVDNTLCEFSGSNANDFELVPILNNVSDVDAERTNMYVNEIDSWSTKTHCIVGAKTLDNELFVFGTWYGSDIRSDATENIVYDEWTLISKNVSDFDINTYALVYLTDEDVHYYGYDMPLNDKGEIIDTIIAQGAESVSFDEGALIVKTKAGWLRWESLSYSKSENDRVLADAFLWEKSKLNNADHNLDPC